MPLEAITFFMFRRSPVTRIVLTVQERIFSIESYIRNIGYEATREEFEQKCQFSISLFFSEHPVLQL
jgi:hypothetical protein